VRIPFIKMEGIGNDYIYIDLLPGRGVPESALGDLSDLARVVSDRHYGIGGDGLILIRPSDVADARMQMFNADGSESEMCGNGIRCVARYLRDEGIVRADATTIETGASVLTLEYRLDGDRVAAVRVDMGAPRLERADIPMLGPPGRVVDEPFVVDGREYRVTAVSMGNPHCVIFVDDLERAPVATLGPRIETDPRFPRRTNVEFVQVLAPGHVRQRTWERGAGETLACGTGASAVCVAGVLTGRTQPVLRNELRGGELRLEWGGPGTPVFMEGPAREVFRGTLDPS
jgi:diaminopimelate epimerase